MTTWHVHTPRGAPVSGDPGDTITLLAPALPDPSGLQGLEPGVAYAFLFVVGLGMLLFYLGPGLRQRFTRPDTPTPDGPGVSGTGPVPPALPAVMDRAEAVYDRLVSHLEGQLAERDRTIKEQDRELVRLRNEIDRLRGDVERLRDQIQWRRGGA